MAKIHVLTVLVHPDGKELKYKEGESDLPLTLRKVCLEALGTMTQADQSMSGEEKFKLYEIASKIAKSSDAELSAEEITKLLSRINAIYGPFVFGPAKTLLDPPAAATPASAAQNNA